MPAYKTGSLFLSSLRLSSSTTPMSMPFRNRTSSRQNPQSIRPQIVDDVANIFGETSTRACDPRRDDLNRNVARLALLFFIRDCRGRDRSCPLRLGLGKVRLRREG